MLVNQRGVIKLHVYEGPLCTQAKGCDHENLRALENHLKAMLWEIESQVCNWWALKPSVKWTWTMLRDCNIVYGPSKIVGSPGPHHGNILFLEAKWQFDFLP